MSAAIPDLIDHAVNLMEGKISGLDRPIATNRFTFVDIPVELCLEQGTRAPFPFEIPPESLAGSYPDDIQHTGSVTDIYDSFTFTIRVGYAANMQDQRLTSKEIAADVYRIRRTLGDQDAWVSNSNFSRVAAGQWGVSSVAIPGSENGEDLEIMFVLEQEFTVTYRESHV